MCLCVCATGSGSLSLITHFPSYRQSRVVGICVHRYFTRAFRQQYGKSNGTIWPKWKQTIAKEIQLVNGTQCKQTYIIFVAFFVRYFDLNAYNSYDKFEIAHSYSKEFHLFPRETQDEDSLESVFLPFLAKVQKRKWMLNKSIETKCLKFGAYLFYLFESVVLSPDTSAPHIFSSAMNN